MKRKRGNASRPFTDVASDSDDVVTAQRDTDSPRMQVASRFDTLEIRETPPPQAIALDVVEDSEDVLSPRTPRKRRRGSTPLPAAENKSDGAWKGTLATHHTVRHRARTPPMPADIPLPATPPSEIESQAPPGSTIRVASGDTPRRSPSQRGEMPPPDLLSAPMDQHKLRTPSPLGRNSGAVSSLRSTKKAAKPDISLTWQAREITGHKIDTTQPDDADGLGINGIGFHPTAAMVEQRRLKRRAQVNEWRMREAKEARQRRIERRGGGGRGGLLGLEGGGGFEVKATESDVVVSKEKDVPEQLVEGSGRETKKRMVRFALVGGE